jgi:hypothetical protein
MTWDIFNTGMTFLSVFGFGLFVGWMLRMEKESR